MKKWVVVILCFFAICSNVKAVSKEDVLNYVNEQTVCDSQTQQLFDSYKILFSRMMKEKELTEKDLENIMNKLTKAVNLLKENDICKNEDLKRIPKSIKDQIKNELYNGAMIIYDAPPIVLENEKPVINNGGIVIDKENNTIDIYQNGSLVDKVELNKNTFTYVGPNKIILATIIISSLLFILSISLYLLLKNKKLKHLNLYLDILFPLATLSFITFFVFILFSKPIGTLLDLSEMLRKPSTNTTKKEIVISENKEILRYPGYGDEYAKLIISNLDINLNVIFGDTKDILNKAIGHTTTSYFPGEGGTIIYSGHNNDKFLYNLKNIKLKDKIEIKTNYGTFIYQVDLIDIMGTSEYDKIKIQNKEENLILYTCYPFSNVLYGKQRYVITASLVEEKWGE